MANREEAMSIQIKRHPVSPVDTTEDRVDTVVTVALGHVTGRIVRSQYDAGTISYDAHIELVGDRSPNQIDDPQDLRNLGTVAITLADELAAVTT
ncbi:hypothetical protein [Mycobacterium sp. D16Q16]|uniref:hypothetical protein n=1 Tax=Mycobacterium sp. D16Q16 TaxID=1855659 RepID=UPI002570C567|nr:hypothetical protein [Mycobacterium sp. D16Q16]